MSGPVPPRPNGAARKARPARADEIVAHVNRLLEGATVSEVYRECVLSDRTRRYELGLSKVQANVEILHTLLGIELKIGRRRLLCPDLATARFLRVFARIGVETIAIPYDITRISRAADELESAWHRAVLLAEHASAGRSERLKSLVRKLLADGMRASIQKLGAGPKKPAFLQSTRQRHPGSGRDV